MLIPSKTQLRQSLRAKISAFPRAALAEASQNIRVALADLPQWRSAHTIAAFMPLPDEPALHPLDWTPAKTLLLPRIQNDDLIFYEVKHPNELICGAFNILEPDPIKCPRPNLAEIQIILVPGVAFTKAGHRLGRGRGFYDRFLATLPSTTLRIGICFPHQIVPHIPTEPHDETVHLVITS